MTDAKLDEYLRRAQEAEDAASKTADPTIKASWLEIAHGYRLLAGVKAELAQKPTKS